MKKTILSFSLAFLGLGAITTSCEDMLTPDMDRYATEFTGTDSINFYLGIVRNMQGMVEQNVLLGDLRSDLVSPTEYVADSVSEIVNFTNLEDGESAILNRAAYYKVINQCNFYLAQVDSMAMKNNSYFMRRELAQVELMRAWTYMQLVQNYGKVPFITRPVDNAATGWETNPAEGWATPDNLLELLEGVEGQNLSQAYGYAQAYGYPSYGNFNNGSVSFNHQLLIFDADLVMGDLYLLRGASKTDYEKAASHYYRYLTTKGENVNLMQRASVVKLQHGDEEPVYYHATTWGSDIFFGNDWTRSREIVTALPSAANSFFGKVLTSIPQIYGFETTSGAHSTTGTNADGEEQTTTSGQVNVTANYKMRQLEPSPAFEALCQAQAVVYNDYDLIDRTQQKAVEYPASLYDARLDISAPKVATEAGRIRFIDKFCGSRSVNVGDYTYPSAFQFRYGIPVYRFRQIYLKYAEAINRAGYPRHAFAILRDGLDMRSMPTIGQITAKADTIWVEEPNNDDPENPVLGDLGSVVLTYDVVADSASQGNTGANCIDLNELYRAKDVEWLDFSETELTRYGIHQAGCGLFTNMDTEFSYENQVLNRIENEKKRSGQTLSSEHALVTNVEAVPGKTKNVNRDLNGLKDYYDFTENVNGFPVYGPAEDEIAAVETLIADEMALELAFEGTRYYDLMRIARHRINAGQDGAQWMAWIIGRRGLGLAPYEQPEQKGSLSVDLTNPENWYLPAPKR